MSNFRNPDLLPDLPNYPVQAKVVRIIGGRIGLNIYSCRVQQSTGAVTLRDREPAYVFEANGVLLAPGYYVAVLVDSYLGLPLFATTCCIAVATDVPTSGTGTPGFPTSGSGGVALSCCPEQQSAVKCVTLTDLGGASVLNGVTIELNYDATLGPWTAPFSSNPGLGYWVGWKKITGCPTEDPLNETWLGFAVGCHVQWRWSFTWQTLLIGTGPPDLNNIPFPILKFDTTVCNPSVLTVTSSEVPQACYSSGGSSVKVVVNDESCAGVGTDVEILGLGTADSVGEVSSLTKSSVTVQAGLLVVNVGIVNNSSTPTVTFNGIEMANSNQGAGFPTIAGSVHQFFKAISAQTGDIVVTTGSGTACISLEAVNVTGLRDNAIDSNNKALGSNSAPNTDTAIISTVSNTAALAVFLMYDLGAIPAHTWAGTPTFTTGAQDVSRTCGLANIVLTEGRKISTATGTFIANLTGVTPDEWVSILVVYR